ncbi:hypothetical protein EMGBS1_06230 [Chloroflexota bacterium]|nr:hypothetical protein EMGBS1_06230 [Chloroflexota bacterium]
MFRTETIAKTLRAGRYVLSGKAKAVRVWREYHAGATVILQSLHRHWPPLQRLCDMLGNEWLSQAQTNIYFTPSGGRGLRRTRTATMCLCCTSRVQKLDGVS